jgi:hypothetical protein
MSLDYERQPLVAHAVIVVVVGVQFHRDSSIESCWRRVTQETLRDARPARVPVPPRIGRGFVQDRSLATRQERRQRHGRRQGRHL